jgi:hypothetical protein
LGKFSEQNKIVLFWEEVLRNPKESWDVENLIESLKSRGIQNSRIPLFPPCIRRTIQIL